MFLKKYNLKKKIAVVTGAGKGLGKACAIALAEAGADLIIISRTKKDLNEVSKVIKKIIDETENSTSIYPTVQKINQEFLKEEKLELIKELWELVSADKIIDPYEENLYFKIAELLKIQRKLANKI